MDQPISWRDKLVGQSSKIDSKESDEKEDFDILEGDIQKSFVNGNKIHSLWKPPAPIHMMDIENGYFLVKFQNKLDCEKAFSEGPWTIFGQYLTVKPWMMDFDPS
ncbi:reverse transcriptase [Gossypium australe]|uniref:Reverse transcriptase n=1 Tax=Gossypium australe TaxID=47621 RepID=A0A5B6UXA0_9ROSI|nr:reverse transcriptase [Gossypium australe]